MIYNNIGGASVARAGYRPATFVIGTSTSGHTYDDCDYLCDGVADDVEINTAIQAMDSRGGKIIILSGKYNLSSPINIDRNYIDIEGEGPDYSTIISSNISDYVIKISGLVNAIKSLCIDGVSYGILIGADETKRTSMTIIDNVSIQRTKHTSIRIGGTVSNNDGVFTTKISNCYINGGFYGIYINGENTKDTHIDKCFIDALASNNEGDSTNNSGIFIIGEPTNIKIRDCDINVSSSSGDGCKGIYITYDPSDSSADVSSNIYILNNTIICSYSGITFDCGPDYNIFSDGSILGNVIKIATDYTNEYSPEHKDYGIVVKKGDNINSGIEHFIISNNRFSVGNSSSTAEYKHAISLISDSCIIQANHIDGSSTVPIIISGDKNLIMGNATDMRIATAVQADGTDNIIINNLGFDN